MRWKHTLLTLALCSLGAGCETPLGTGLDILRYTGRNLFEYPVDIRDDFAERAHCCHLAEEAWDAVQREHPAVVYSVHYARGFKDGFADYLYAGGTGAPLPEPPWQYRRAVYETSEGLHAVEDWLAGYPHGARVAQESGLRKLIVVPLALPPPGPPAWVAALAPCADDLLPPPQKMPRVEPEDGAVPPKNP